MEAINLCYKGFYLNRLQIMKFRNHKLFIKAYKPDEKGLYKNKQLGDTLTMIAEIGEAYFYQGELADKIVNITNITHSDLENYEVKAKKPLNKMLGENGLEVYTANLPSGGTFIIQTLYILLKILPNKLDYKLLIQYLTNVVIFIQNESFTTFGDLNRQANEELISDQYLEHLKNKFSFYEKFDSYKTIDYNSTTHIVVKDKENNYVSVTNSISSVFGSQINVDGFYLNNQLKNFSQIVGNPNIRKEYNRPFSFVAPTILFEKNNFIINIGAAGGFKLPTILSYVLTLVLKYKFGVRDAIKNPRFVLFNQELKIEKGFNELVNFGNITHRLQEDQFFWGSIQAIYSSIKNNETVSDFRRIQL